MNDEQILAWLKKNEPKSTEGAFAVLRNSLVTRDEVRRVWIEYKHWLGNVSYERAIARQKDTIHGEESKTIVWDIEVCPAWGWFYDPYKKNNILRIEGDPQIIAYSYGYLNEEKVYGKTLADYPNYKAGRFNVDDKDIVTDLHAVLSSVQTLIGHNSDNFDLKTAQARFWYHDLPPIQKRVKIDTMKGGKRAFKIPKHSLKDTLRYKQLGDKAKETHGMLLWDCLEGSKPHWNKMKKYCNQDVSETRKLYRSERGFYENHPNMSFFTRGERECPTCLSKDIKYTNRDRSFRNGIKKIYQCSPCGRTFDGELLKDGYDKIKTF